MFLFIYSDDDDLMKPGLHTKTKQHIQSYEVRSQDFGTIVLADLLCVGRGPKPIKH